MDFNSGGASETSCARDERQEEQKPHSAYASTSAWEDKGEADKKQAYMPHSSPGATTAAVQTSEPAYRYRFGFENLEVTNEELPYHNVPEDVSNGARQNSILIHPQADFSEILAEHQAIVESTPELLTPAATFIHIRDMRQVRATSRRCCQVVEQLLMKYQMAPAEQDPIITRPHDSFTDGSSKEAGSGDFASYVRFSSQLSTQDQDMDYEAFCSLVPDDMGKVSVTDVRSQVMAGMGYAESEKGMIDELLRSMDLDGDGKLDYSEFTRVWRHVESADFP